MQAFAAGRFSEALEEFSRAAEQYPGVAACRCNVAAARAALELHRACVKDCDAAIAADAGYLPAYLLKGRAWLALGKPGKAKTAWNAGIAAAAASPASPPPDAALVLELRRAVLEARAAAAAAVAAPTSAAAAAAAPAAAATATAVHRAVAASAPPAPTPVSKSRSSSSSSSSSSSKEGAAAAGAGAANPAVAQYASQCLSQAEGFAAKKAWRNACEVWEQVLALRPGSLVAAGCCRRIADAALANAQWAKAAARYGEALGLLGSLVGDEAGQGEVDLLCADPASMGAVQLRSPSGGAAAKDQRTALHEALHCLVRRARALSLAEDHQSALSTGQRAFALLKPLEDGGAWPSKQPATATATALPHLTLDDTQAELARCCLRAGLEDEAIALAQGVLEHDEEHGLALHTYALLAAARGKGADAVRILLRILVKDTENKAVKADFSRLVGGETSFGAADADAVGGGAGAGGEDGRAGLDALLSDLQSGPGAATAIGFLATVVRDYGQLQAAADLYKLTVASSPENYNYALNYVHVLENMAEYDMALAEAAKLLASRPADALLNGLRNEHMLERLAPVLAELGQQGGGQQGQKKGHAPPKGAKQQQQQQQQPVAAATVRSGYSYSGAATQWGLEWVEGPPSEKKGEGASVRASRSDGAPVVPPEAAAAKAKASKLKSHSADHDQIALYFTVVKLLYATGRLDAIPPLVALLEPAREGRELGSTLVRNEQAYYVCITQLLCTHPLVAVDTLQARAEAAAAKDGDGDGDGDGDSDGAETIYVCGDSHSLCPSWRTVRAGGAPRLLASALVTGLKHWHMRPDSVFYPKANLYRVLDTLPRGAKVVFLFGEIDCREGILLAVEKGRYASVEEGAAVCVDIFLAAIEGIIARYGFEVLVHPIVPVLNETRKMVRLYNRIFHAKVKASALPLKWLDFFDQMLTPDAASLRPELALDGTHLSPAYLPLLEAALDKVL